MGGAAWLAFRGGMERGVPGSGDMLVANALFYTSQLPPRF